MEAEDAKQRFPKEYTTWREDPINFNVNGNYPIRDLWGTAAEAWREILSNPVSLCIMNIVGLHIYLIYIVICSLSMKVALRVWDGLT